MEHASCSTSSACSSSSSSPLPPAVELAVAFASEPLLSHSPVYTPTSPAEDALTELPQFSCEETPDEQVSSEEIPEDVQEPRRPARRSLLQHAVSEKCRARGAATGRRTMEPPAGQGHVGGGKRRRVAVGNDAEEDEEVVANEPCSSEDDKPLADLRALHPHGRRQIRPYSGCVSYGPLWRRSARRRRVHLGRQPRKRRLMSGLHHGALL
jgi:hypothetical protein